MGSLPITKCSTHSKDKDKGNTHQTKWEGVDTIRACMEARATRNGEHSDNDINIILSIKIWTFLQLKAVLFGCFLSTNKKNNQAYHWDLIFSQFFINEWSTLWTFYPPVDIICSCCMSSVSSSFSRSICLFRWCIITFFFSMSFSTKGILPKYFCKAPSVGAIYMEIYPVILFKASVLLLLVVVLVSNSVIFSLNYFERFFSVSKASVSSFFYWIRLEHSCSRFLSRSVISSYCSPFSTKLTAISLSIFLFVLRVCSWIRVPTYLSKCCSSNRYVSARLVTLVFCCL